MGFSIIRGLFFAEILADSFVRVSKSYNPQGFHRLTTMRVVFPRIVLAELNTHRLLSRNSASSRAIPAAKMRESVAKNPFIPDRYPKEHKGMQASEWVDGDSLQGMALEDEWRKVCDMVVGISQRLSDLGISKQLSNRFLEPVMMHQVIISSTEWENFFSLRADPPAQNEIRILAEIMLELMNFSNPRELFPGEWHMPFGDQLDDDRIAQAWKHNCPDEGEPSQSEIDVYVRRIAVARCARISYNTFEGKDDYLADLRLYNQLSESGHWSPFEHVARAMNKTEYRQYSHNTPDDVEYGWCGNFRGFIQLRKTFPRTTENRPDSRLKRIEL